MSGTNTKRTKDAEVQESPSLKRCFVIMPISDVSGYDNRHFDRVYEYLIKPAVVAAGFVPYRADDSFKTDYIVVDIVRNVVESDLVLCDFSARNPNVMYELGIRHAYDKPVVLIKDQLTDKIFDISGLRYMEYDHTLRIDSVQQNINSLTSTIKETVNRELDSVNSIIKLAGISAAQTKHTSISPETQLILNAIEPLNRRLTLIEKSSSAPSSTPNFIGAPGIPASLPPAPPPPVPPVFLSDGTLAKVGLNVSSIDNVVAGTIQNIRYANGKLEILLSNGSDMYRYSDPSRLKVFS